MKKKLGMIACVLGIVVLLFGCGAGSGSGSGGVSIDYGTSEIYTHEDMDQAIAVIKDEFSKWEGCKLYNIRYTSDEENNEENIQWMNELAEGQGLEGGYTQVIEFLSDFHSPVEQDEPSAWEPDTDYTDWNWWLARTDGGEWQLLTSGYGR